MTELITEDMMVPSEPGIEIFVRNKRPAESREIHAGAHACCSCTARPIRRTPASTCRSAGSRGWSPSPRAATTSIASTCAAMAARRGPRRWPSRRRTIRRRAHAGRGEGHHRGAQLRSQAPQHSEAQPARLVVGLHPDGDHRDPEPRQGGAADALRAAAGCAPRRRCSRRARARSAPTAP